MAKKLTYQEVKEFIEGEGYELLSKEYVNSRSKILVRCPEGHEYEVGFNSFKSTGRRCPICSLKRRAEKRKYDYSYVKNFIESEGFELLSDEYTGCRDKLLVRCPEGHEIKISFFCFKRGVRCKICNKKKKYTFQEVRELVESEGYTLLSSKDEYKNSHSKIKLRCPKGHEYEVVFYSFTQGKRCRICKGNWRKNVKKRNVAWYDTYAPQLEWCEEVRRDPEDPDILQVRCYESNCKRWFTPTLRSVKMRIEVFKGRTEGECHFYCSDECKQRCSVYRKIKYPKGREEYNLGREVQSELRDIVFERDGWTCQKCGSKDDLQCHHILPVKLEPLESADVDNCITLCKKCHIEIHQIAGCTYGELRSVC